jgi:DNA-binding NarL/FixJ family response regulator
MPAIRLIIALPSRLLATALADYIEDKSLDVKVTGVAADSKEIFALLDRMPSRVLLYDPYLPGLAPQIVCSRLRTEFPNLKIILMKNTNSQRPLSTRPENAAPPPSSAAMPPLTSCLNLIEQTGQFFSH